MGWSNCLPRIGSGRVETVRVRSRRVGLRQDSSFWVGSGRDSSGQVALGRVASSQLVASGWVASRQFGSGRVGSGCVKTVRARSRRVGLPRGSSGQVASRRLGWFQLEAHGKLAGTGQSVKTRDIWICCKTFLNTSLLIHPPFCPLVRCSHKFTGLSGEFESPNYANNYPDSLNCSYLVQAPFGYIITLSFLHFDLEPRYKDFCKFDFLEVFDGAQSNSTSLGKFCGSRAPAPVHSTSNSLLVMFVTDLSEHYTGFRVSYGTKKGKDKL